VKRRVFGINLGSQRTKAIDQSKVRVGLTFNNLESMVLKIIFNML